MDDPGRAPEQKDGGHLRHDRGGGSVVELDAGYHAVGSDYDAIRRVPKHYTKQSNCACVLLCRGVMVVSTGERSNYCLLPG